MKNIIYLLLILSYGCVGEAPKNETIYHGQVIGKSMTNSIFGDQCIIALRTKTDTVILKTHTPSYIGYEIHAKLNRGDFIQVTTRKNGLFHTPDLIIIPK